MQADLAEAKLHCFSLLVPDVSTHREDRGMWKDFEIGWSEMASEDILGPKMSLL